MPFNKVVYDGRVLIDLTRDSVTEDTLLEGITAHKADGTPITGNISLSTENRIQCFGPLLDTDGSAILDAAGNVIIAEWDFVLA